MEPPPLSWYVAALFAVLERDDPPSASRLRQVAGNRAARIRLDDEAVLVRFVGGVLQVEPDRPGAALDGEGGSDRATVVDLLEGHLEAFDALSSGRVEVVGEPEAVAAMLQIVEVLLDASSRVPALQGMADRLVATTTRPPRPSPPLATGGRYPDELTAAELELLASLDLLPDDTEG